MTVEVLDDVAALSRLRGEWEQLMSRASNDRPTLSPVWQLAWWDVFGSTGGRDLRVAVVRDRGAIVALAPLCRRTFRYFGCLPFRRLELSASGEDEADEICSDYLGVLCARGAEQAIALAFARAIADGHLGECDELVMPHMDGGHVLPRLLEQACDVVGLAVASEVTSRSPHVPLPGSFDAYMQQLSSDHRYVVKRSLRDFERWAGNAWTLHVARTAGELARGREVLEALHAERWSADGEPSLFGSPRFAAFHDRVMPELLARDALELSWIEVRGEPIVALYSIVWGDTVYFYQSGRKLDLAKGVRPGVVAHALAIRRAIEAGRREYDFLPGTSRYKMELATSVRPLVTVRAVRRSLLEHARLSAEKGVAWLRAASRQLRRPPSP